MKRFLLLVASFATALALALPSPSVASRIQCFEENYGSGQCGTTCVMYNDQGNIGYWDTTYCAC